MPSDSGAFTLVAEIARLMHAAEQARGRYVRLADRAARLYAPAVHALGAITFIGWMLAGAGWEQSLTFAISVENFTSAIGTVIFVGYLSALCKNPLHTATQFALLTALSAMGRTYLSAGAGYVAEAAGWAWFDTPRAGIAGAARAMVAAAIVQAIVSAVIVLRRIPAEKRP